MIRYDPTLMDLTINFFVLYTNVKIYLYNYSKLVDLNMNIHDGNGYIINSSSWFDTTRLR